jgi:hypothetical protein
MDSITAHYNVIQPTSGLEFLVIQHPLVSLRSLGVIHI